MMVNFVSLEGLSLQPVSARRRRGHRQCSSTWTACSRLTVGKLSRNSSRLSSASTFSIRASTGTRVPRRTTTDDVRIGADRELPPHGLVDDERHSANDAGTRPCSPSPAGYLAAQRPGG